MERTAIRNCIWTAAAGSISLPANFTFTTSNNSVVDTTDGTIVNDAGTNSIAGAFTLTSGGGSTVFNSKAGLLTVTATLRPAARPGGH